MLSVSIASNVPDFEDAKCFVTEGDPRQLVSRMVNYLHDTSRAAEVRVKETFTDVMTQIDELIVLQKEEIGQENDTDEKRSESEREEDTRHKTRRKNPAERLKKEFVEYMGQLPVLGFNSGSYDLNVIR